MQNDSNPVKHSQRYLCLLVVLFLVSNGCRSSRTLEANTNGVHSFALIGDMPYGPEGEEKFVQLQEEINGREGLEWVLHVGDIKTGGTSCSDQFLTNRFDMFQRFDIPFVWVPGDNEWTDCHRASAGGFDPLERLDYVRTLFYPRPGQALAKGTLLMETQASEEAYRTYPEHVRWVKDGVMYVGLHIVGSANSMAPFPGQTEAHTEEAQARMDAAIAWMQASFEEARRIQSPGLFLMIHANPFFEAAAAVFNPFLQALEEEVLRFGKPVLMAHGDSHYFRVDKPLMGTFTGRRIERFTRVETFGAGDIHWIRVYVDPEDVNVFTVRQEIVTENVVEEHRDR